MKPVCFSTKISLDKAKKLKDDLTDQGFSFTQPPYTIFSAKKKGISIALYESGKLTVQGKEKDEFIEFYLEPNILESFEYSHPESEKDLSEHIGVDEAGKGDFFGPLCIAGVFATPAQIKELMNIGVKDSKRFSDSKILKMSPQIKKIATHQLIRIFPKKYNELYAKFKNLNSLLGWGHATVIYELYKKTNSPKALIDQFASKHVVEKALMKKKIPIQLEQKHKGEEDVVVAAASIIARAAFLEGMEALSKEFDIPLPKGASKEVEKTAKKILAKQGINTLDAVSKTHFKTYKEIIEDADISKNS
ncbi:MAG TPA: ribonuclease HIII [Chlamydiales bacterium]|nr:ribonuclease HIII [Chlamydiales bacterium]